MFSNAFKTLPLAMTVLSGTALADFFVANYVVASCGQVSGGCIGEQSYATGIVSVSDYSASNIKGSGPYTNQANPATDNFVVNSVGECGSPTQISFETTDGGANYIAHDGPGGAEVGACYRDTDEVATEPTGCCPQIESVSSLLYCSSASINC